MRTPDWTLRRLSADLAATKPAIGGAFVKVECGALAALIADARELGDLGHIADASRRARALAADLEARLADAEALVSALQAAPAKANDAAPAAEASPAALHEADDPQARGWERRA